MVGAPLTQHVPRWHQRVGPRGARLLIVAAVVISAASQTVCSEPRKVDGFPDEFVGVGVELKLKDQRPHVMRILPSGAADEAGLKKGDVVVAIDGDDTRGVGLGDIVMRLRGKPGSQVTMDVDRYGTRMIVVVRRKKMTKSATGYKSGS